MGMDYSVKDSREELNIGVLEEGSIVNMHGEFHCLTVVSREENVHRNLYQRMQ